MWLHFLLPIGYSALFFTSFESSQLYGLFVIGIFAGFGFLQIDRVIHAFFIDPEHEFSVALQQAWRERRPVFFIKLLLQAQTMQQRLMTRSVLFMLTYIALTLYVLTSTGSALGAGFMLGLGLHYCLDLWLYQRDVTLFHEHFLWQLKRQLAVQEVRSLLAAFTVFFIMMSLLVLVQ